MQFCLLDFLRSPLAILHVHSSSLALSGLITAGMPTAIQPSGTSVKTTAFAPITTSFRSLRGQEFLRLRQYPHVPLRIGAPPGSRGTDSHLLENQAIRAYVGVGVITTPFGCGSRSPPAILVLIGISCPGYCAPKPMAEVLPIFAAVTTLAGRSTVLLVGADTRQQRAGPGSQQNQKDYAHATCQVFQLMAKTLCYTHYYSISAALNRLNRNLTITANTRSISSLRVQDNSSRHFLMHPYAKSTQL